MLILKADKPSSLERLPFNDLPFFIQVTQRFKHSVYLHIPTSAYIVYKFMSMWVYVI